MPLQADLSRIYAAETTGNMANSTQTTSYLKNPENTLLPSLRDEEKDILKELKAGQHEAMDYLFDRYYNMMCSKALHYVHDSEKAEDIVQDVFFNIWKKRAEMDIHFSIRAYLIRCVTNRALNYIRDKKRITFELDDQIKDHSTNIEEDIYYSETEKFILDQINTLSPRCRQIFKMNRIEQMKYKEIAVELNISIKTVEHHIAKGLHFVREKLIGQKQMSYC